MNEEIVPVQYAQAQVTDAPGADGGGFFGGPFLFLAAMLLLMYALIIRPQQRQQKEQKAMLAKVGKGDTIVTTGGIHGRVVGVTDDVLTVEIANNVRMKLDKSAVGRRIVASDGEKS